mgnify:CR=1 FL=1|tara:strand:+ start:215 stop:748 length:534 start_codon:yes stop_codon:yes gene_type:complete
MAFKMKGPSLYSSSPLKQDTRADALKKSTAGDKLVKKTKGLTKPLTDALKKSRINRTEGKLKKKEDTTADGKMTLKKTRNEKITEAYPGPKRDKKKPTVKPKKSFSNPDGSVNIPVNPKAPKVKVPKNNASVKGKTQFEVDTQGVRNVIGKAINNRKQNIKRVKKTVSKVKDYFTKR